MVHYTSCIRCDTPLQLKRVDSVRPGDIPIQYTRETFDLDQDSYFIRLLNSSALSSVLTQPEYNKLNKLHDNISKEAETNILKPEWREVIIERELKKAQVGYSENRKKLDDLIQSFSESFDKEIRNSRTPRYAMDIKCSNEIFRKGKFEKIRSSYDQKPMIGKLRVNALEFEYLPYKLLHYSGIKTEEKENYKFGRIGNLHLEFMHFSCVKNRKITI